MTTGAAGGGKGSGGAARSRGLHAGDRKPFDRREFARGFGWILLFATGYFVLCVAANGWSIVAGAIAFVIAPFFFGAIGLVGVLVSHGFARIGEGDGDAWWQQGARWASEQMDADGDDDWDFDGTD